MARTRIGAVGAVLLAVPALGVACGATRLRGALAVPAGREPPGTVVAVLDATSCTDAVGGPATWNARVFLVRDEFGVVRVVEARPGHDSWVTSKPRSEAGDAVVQVVAAPSEGRAWLHEYRFRSADLAAGGEFAVSDAWTEASDSGDQIVHATAGTVRVKCRLTPFAPSAASSAALGLLPAPAPPPGASGR